MKTIEYVTDAANAAIPEPPVVQASDDDRTTRSFGGSLIPNRLARAPVCTPTNVGVQESQSPSPDPLSPDFRRGTEDASDQTLIAPAGSSGRSIRVIRSSSPM